ncbi:hypothetical protein POVCU2_0086790 [Plasmodium ovale curtisi]|uniref:PIR Superfamily Protein n=1 Tax=Plasmodium ovale curtisi TaxID=864141 RepID=A0A1A8X7B9_PLAOA|nr:hypothetical protein POVCU2_0086790 [Plasmodium ovale curtisi]SBT00503.1 hypothetical protein POVCU1_060420 [Plasmodium ovale curtisi]
MDACTREFCYYIKESRKLHEKLKASCHPNNEEPKCHVIKDIEKINDYDKIKKLKCDKLKYPLSKFMLISFRSKLPNLFLGREIDAYYESEDETLELLDDIHETMDRTTYDSRYDIWLSSTMK